MKEVITIEITTTQLNQLVVACKTKDETTRLEFVQVHEDANFMDYSEVREYINRVVANINNLDFDPEFRLSASDSRKVLKC